DVQKALLKVLRDPRIAYLTTGHGEMNDGGDATDGRTAKALRRLVESQNYQVKDLGLTQGLGTDVPADATIVLVLGPTKPMLPEEITALKRYADRGGHVLFALDPEAKIELGDFAAIAGLSWSNVPLANDRVYIPRRRNASDKRNIVTNRF